jgi:hypothetical protein
MLLLLLLLLPTQVALPALSLDKFTDSYFKAAEEKSKKKKGEDEFFKSGADFSWVLHDAPPALCR